MAEPEPNNQEEQPPSKHKTLQQDTHHLPNKTPKITTTVDHNHSQQSQIPTTVNSSSDPDPVPNKELGDDHEDDNKEPQIDTNEDDEEDDEEEDSDGEPVVDRKGNGILRNDKGKGKMIEEEEDDDEDDSDDNSDDDSDANVLGSDSEFFDDLLAEVDLNNILPSRTRRRTSYTGVHIFGGTVNL